MRKTTKLEVYPKPPKPPKTQVLTAVRMPGATLTSKLIKPVGAAVFLLTSLVWAQPTVITAPMGNQPANVPATCAALQALGVFNVRCPPFLATGNGFADDTVAIQKAITAASQSGTTSDAGARVRLPPGTYMISAPLILPRSGVTPNHVVWLEGQTNRATILKGTTTFPTNRAIIEWDQSAAVPAWNNKISNLRIFVPSVSGAMAIHYQVTLNATFNQIHAERWNGVLEHLNVEGSNQFHTKLIYLEGEQVYSRIEDIQCDPSQGTVTFDTLCLQVDSNIFGAPVGQEGSGFQFSYLDGLTSTTRRGGFSLAFSGRIMDSQFKNVNCNGTKFADICFNFVNTASSVLVNLTNEGQSDQPQIRFTNSYGNTIQQIQMGTPNNAGGGVGNGMELVGSSSNTFIGLALGTVTTFNSQGVKMLTLDASSKDNVFLNWDVRGDPATEVTDSGSRNFFRYNRTDTGRQLTVGAQSTTTFADLGTPANGTLTYCSDCNPSVNPCTSGGSGSLALRQGGAWRCL